jgi:hypothetical protein
VIQDFLSIIDVGLVLSYTSGVKVDFPLDKHYSLCDFFI